MLVCAFCSTENPEHANFCYNCGRKLGNKRGLLVLNRAEFCFNCGKRMEQYPAERKVATILFADVSGFTAMSEKIGDIERITEIMNDCFNRLSKKIVEQGGSIDKYVGDMIMGRFGAPEAHEDDPERAVRAAIGMQKELEQISAELQRKVGSALSMRIGLNTGWVYAGLVGAEIDDVSYRSYTVMGGPVNLASRLEHDARIGKILVGEETYSQTQHAFDFVDAGKRQIRGFQELIQTYEVVGPKPLRVNKRGLAGKELPLIGRDQELEALRDYLNRAITKQGQVVTVTGEAGVGKSSLIREFKRLVNRDLPDVWYIGGAAFSYSSSQPFSVVRNAMYKLCNIYDNDDDELILQKLLGTISLLMGEAGQNEQGDYSELASLLGRALGFNLPNPFIDNLDPLLRSNLLTDAISDFLLKKADTNPLILLLDDLHWADPSSLEVIDRLVKKVTTDTLPVLLMLLHRPDFQYDWNVSPNSQERFHHIMLERLGDKQMPRLVRQILEALTDAPRSIRADFEGTAEEVQILTVVEKANGNPFFVEEIMKGLLNAQLIVRDEGEPSGFRVTGDLNQFRVPSSLREILFTRIDRLDGRDKRVLQVGSVIGSRFEHRLLFSVRDLEEQPHAVEEALTTLHNEDFIETLREEPDPEYGFRHTLTREVAYDNLLSAERKIYHEQIASGLERFYVDRLQDPTLLNELAYHYDNTDNDQKAILYLMQAGDMRRSLYRNEEALQAYLKAKERLLRQPKNNRYNANLVGVNTNIGDLLNLKQRYAEAQSMYEEALALCKNLTDSLDLRAKIIEVLNPRGEFERALQVYDRTAQEFSKIDHPSDAMLNQWAKVLMQIGRIYYSQANSTQAIEFYNQSRMLWESLPDPTGTIKKNIGQLYSRLSSVYAEMGQLDEAVAALQKTIEIAESSTDLALAAEAYVNLAGCYIPTGKLVEAERLLKQARQNAEKVGADETLFVVIGSLGSVAERQGKLVKALEYYREAEKAFEEASSFGFLALAKINIGQVLIQQGKSVEALTIFQQAIDYAESLGYKSLIAEGTIYTGYAYLLSNDFSRAALWLERGFTTATESGNPEKIALANLYLAYMEKERTKFEQARTYIAESLKAAELAGNDPILLGRIKRLEGELAIKETAYAKAEEAFASSLKFFEPMRAFLEMSLTKLYWAELILQKYESNLLDPETQADELEMGQSYLYQASITFDACDATLGYQEAQKLLTRFPGETLAA
jgi:adenylate cyclase